MKLIDLIGFFRRGGSYDAFCLANSLDANSEAIEIYGQMPLSMESALGFLPIEESKGKIQMEIDGAHYVNLFDFFYFQDVITDAKNTPEMDDRSLAAKLMNYAIKDA